MTRFYLHSHITFLFRLCRFSQSLIRLQIKYNIYICSLYNLIAIYVIWIDDLNFYFWTQFSKSLDPVQKCSRLVLLYVDDSSKFYFHLKKIQLCEIVAKQCVMFGPKALINFSYWLKNIMWLDELFIWQLSHKVWATANILLVKKNGGTSISYSMVYIQYIQSRLRVSNRVHKFTLAHSDIPL